MKPPIGAATRLVALLGDPVAQSLSPRFQNAAFAAAGVDGVYVALRCSDADLPGLLLGIARGGGAGNVTMPHKARAAAAVEVATDAVRRTGACNTFWLEDGRVHGDNTDVAGFLHAARSLAGDVAGARVLLLGAGGAAGAALLALLDAGAGEVVLLNRTPHRAAALGAALDPAGRRTRIAAGGDVAGEPFDLVVNATALGLRPSDPLPLDLAETGRCGAVLDLVYKRGETPWVRHARDLGVAAADGTEMLLHQGAAAFERWWGAAAPLDAMRSALAGA